MDKKEFAILLNSREYREEISRTEAQMAEKAGLVIVYGASDDLIEFDGAINDEQGCYEGGTIYMGEKGVFSIDCENRDCPLLVERLKQCKTIKAIWGKDGYSWTYETNIPHETFDIMEDGEKYCRGIVFDIADLRG